MSRLQPERAPGAEEAEGAPARLPRGRHGLSRAQVVGSQRARLLRAMAQACAADGYAGTSVAEVVRIAGVSRETFYEQFEDKQDCFLAVYEAGAELLLARMEGARAGGGDTLASFERALGAYLEQLAAEPAIARVLLLEIYAAGPAAVSRRFAVQERFVERLAELLEAGDERRRFACEALVAAVSSLVAARLAADDIEGLLALRRPLAELAESLFAA